MQIGIRRILPLLRDIDLHANWRARIEALANASIQERGFGQGNDVRLVLGQRPGVGLSRQLDPRMAHVFQPCLGAVRIYFRRRQDRLILTELHRLDVYVLGVCQYCHALLHVVQREVITIHGLLERGGFVYPSSHHHLQHNRISPSKINGAGPANRCWIRRPALFECAAPVPSFDSAEKAITQGCAASRDNPGRLVQSVALRHNQK